MRPNCHGHR
uniref:AHA11 n=1 Tax=Arundo donax TaxID=35708 RepID=A0A0A9ESU9_ARUDO